MLRIKQSSIIQPCWYMAHWMISLPTLKLFIKKHF